MKFFEVRICNGDDFDDDLMVVKSDTDLHKGDIALFNHYGDWFHGTVGKSIDLLTGVTKFKNAPEVISFIDIIKYNKEREKEITKALLINEMDELETEIKINDKRTKLASSDSRYKELFDKLKEVDKPTVIPPLDDEQMKGDEGAI